MTQPFTGEVLTLWDGSAGLHLVCAPGRPASLVGGHADDAGRADLLAAAVQPLVEVLAVGHGRSSANIRHTATALGTRLRVTGVTVDHSVDRRVVQVSQVDSVTGLHVVVTLEVQGRSVRATTHLHNRGAEPLHLQAVTSLALSAPLGDTDLADILSVEGSSDWLGESRWLQSELRSQEGLVHLDLPLHQHQDARGARSIVSHGSWSTGERIPTGILASRGGDVSVGWQVEHNGAWKVELAERLGTDDRSVLALLLLGPTDSDHQWLHTLEPGGHFEGVPATVCAVPGTWQEAVGELTRHRRRTRRSAVEEPFVVFNDYMNTLMGDPTTARLLPLVDAAAAVGAEIFCIDAGWYDDGGDWWDSVGMWEPSVTRFPGGGLKVVVDHIRSRGLAPGLWLEPEVVGVRSPLADQLPPEAFLQRRGHRIVEHGRFLLDLRHEAAVKRLDSVVDRLVDDFGIRYFKLDYNVTPGPGTDRDADSVGDGLLEHNRALLGWLDGVLERHPGLIVESCASGGMRSDFATLSRSTLQSTSDQQNPLLYPPIAAGALVSILPEQAANWAYPQPEMTAEQVVFTLCTGLAGRFYLSGRLDEMSAAQLATVAEAAALAASQRQWLHAAEPRWPLGLPRWQDTWVSSALHTNDQTLATVWFRGGSECEVVLELPCGEIDIAFPREEPGVPWSIAREDDGRVRVRVSSAEPQARVLRITHPSV